MPDYAAGMGSAKLTADLAKECPMIRLLPGLCAAAFAMALPMAALAQEACAIPAYSVGNLGISIAVHEAPGIGSPVLGVLLPGEKGTDDDGLGAEFTIAEAKDGWVRIVGVTGIDGIGPGGPEGWIDGAYVRFVAQTDLGFAAPDAESDVVYTARTAPGWPFAQAVLGCSGDWVQIRFDVLQDSPQDWMALGQTTAWVRGACSNQRTTCDGVYGDRM